MYKTYTERDIFRAEALDKVINKQITQVQWAEQLCISDRQMKRIVKRYKQYWIEWIIHKWKWKTWNRNKCINKELIVDIIKQPEYEWFKPTFLKEKLFEIYNIRISKETLRQIMIGSHLWYSKNKPNITYRKCRPRKDCFWDMIQFDWSYHQWLETNEYYCLLLAVDDATGMIMRAILTEWESYEEIVNFWKEYVLYYWVPAFIYLDRLSTYKVTYAKRKLDKNLKTNFDDSMRKLWCKLIFAYSPQAKWRVERCNKTLQDRLIKEFRLAWIKNTKDANKFIKDVFIPKYNTKFSIPANNKENHHKKLSNHITESIDRYFAKQDIRILQPDFIIQYKKRCFQIHKPKNKEYTVYPKKKLLLLETLDGKVDIKDWEKSLIFDEIDYTNVQIKRARYFSEKKKAQKEIEMQKIKQRDKERFEKSKKTQHHYKAVRLIEKAKKEDISNCW